jgi:HEAT repeat protein
MAAILGERPQVVSLISKFVEEDYEGSDAAAIRAMSFALDPELTPHIEKLVERIDNIELQRTAFNLLARINTAKSTESLERYLTSDDPQTQAGAVWALSRQNDAAHNLILTEAVAGRTLQRGAIGEIAQSPAASAVFGDLLSRETINDQQKIDLLKIVAAETQHAPGEVRNSMADVAAALLYSPNEQVQRQALETLGTVAAMKDLTDAIEPKLESSNFTIQKAALDAFIQYLTPSSYEPLKKLWYHEDEKMRRTAFFFSEPFLGQRDVPDLQKAAQHSDQFIAKHSAMMLQYLKSD